MNNTTNLLTSLQIDGLFVKTISYSSSAHGQYITLNAGGVEVFVSRSKHDTTVKVMNAAGRLNRGLGKVFFGGFDKALEGYKSKEARAAIQAAQIIMEPVGITNRFALLN